ncbi:MAG: ABC transporter ATP-binding protein [Muribaculaceae bacterium]|nr:ABC transporter ATP-binding protein [Muribaculaceae bacterium]
MIELKNIYKSFGSLEVLRNVSATINNGEVVSIVGPSGAGKTTLLQIAGSLDKADSGNILYDGIDISTLSEKKLAEFRNSKIGFVFQFHQLLPEFTAIENVAIPALIAGGKKADVMRKASELLSLVGMQERADHKPPELSGGEKQRVAVARAIINSPDVIFADEPSGSLDSKNKDELHKLFFDLRARFNQTFVIVTHDEHLASMCDRILKMEDGKFIE